MKKAKHILTLRVTLAVPEGATTPRVTDYVRSAVKTHCGGLDPQGDPMFELDKDTVKVSLLKRLTVWEAP